MTQSPSLTLEQIALLSRRREQLREAMQALEAFLSGRTTPVADLAAPGPNDPSRPNDLDAPSLAQRLTDAYGVAESLDALKEAGHFARYRACSLAEAPLPRVPQPALVGPFFACAVRLAAETPWYAGTANDIVALGQSVQHHRGREALLLFDELREGGDYLARGVPRPDDFFHMMDDLYAVLAQGRIADAIPSHLSAPVMACNPHQFSDEAELAYLSSLSPAELDALVAEGGPQARLVEEHRAELEVAWNALVEASEPLSPEEAQGLEELEREERRAYDRAAARLDRWRERFADAETFCQQYLAFRDAFFGDEGCPADFAERVEQAVDLVLAEKGNSLLARKETVDEALHLLGRVRVRLGQPQAQGQTPGEGGRSE